MELPPLPPDATEEVPVSSHNCYCSVYVVCKYVQGFI